MSTLSSSCSWNPSQIGHIKNSTLQESHTEVITSPISLLTFTNVKSRLKLVMKHLQYKLRKLIYPSTWRVFSLGMVWLNLLLNSLAYRNMLALLLNMLSWMNLLALVWGQRFLLARDYRATAMTLLRDLLVSACCVFSDQDSMSWCAAIFRTGLPAAL